MYIHMCVRHIRSDCMNINVHLLPGVGVSVGACVYPTAVQCTLVCCWETLTQRLHFTLANVSNEVERQCKACTCLHLHHNV